MSRYTSDGRRISSMTHARRGHECDICGETVYGNGGKVAHGRKHVNRGEAVELLRYFETGGSSRAFVKSDDTETIQRFIDRGSYIVRKGKQ